MWTCGRRRFRRRHETGDEGDHRRDDGNISGYVCLLSCGLGNVRQGLAIGWEKNSESDTTGAIITAFHPVWERPNLGGAVAGLAIEASSTCTTTGRRRRTGRGLASGIDSMP